MKVVRRVEAGDKVADNPPKYEHKPAYSSVWPPWNRGFAKVNSGVLVLFGFAVVILSLILLQSAVSKGSLFRVDLVSAPMLALVSYVGAIVFRFAAIHLRDERGRGAFLALLWATWASTVVMVSAGNLILLVAGWAATSLGLNRLLLSFPDRPAAVRAARKKFVAARVSDIALVGATVLLAWRCGTTDLATVLAQARAHPTDDAFAWAGGLLALAAIAKSAQFPFHSWLVESMETPTPVSALLHAGLINAGGFLLVRFADVLSCAPAGMAGLVVVGGFTALFGGLVMLTQPAVKTSLAWSTVGQMGFMILECGLGLFPIAMLHILAHSLYKAHAFLSSGGAVERVAAIRRPGPVAIPGGKAVLRAFLIALFIYLAAASASGAIHSSPQELALGAVLIFGVAYMLAQGLADAAPRALMRRTTVYALLTSVAYFALQAAATGAARGLLPPPPAPGPLQAVLIALTLVSFGSVAVVQAMFPLWADHPAAQGLRVHLANGFYINALWDRALDGWGRIGRQGSAEKRTA